MGAIGAHGNMSGRRAAMLTISVLFVWACGAAPGLASAATHPGADCQPYSGRVCLFPFPDNRFTRLDRTSATGRRVHLPAGAMPVNIKGQRIGVAPFDRNDGFSPGSAVILHIAGLDNQQAMNRTGAVPLVNMARAYSKRQPVLLIDEATGRRQLIWSELDANASSPANTDFEIHPAKALLEGHTYIVALRFLRTASGRPIGAPRWFAQLRRGGKIPAAERSQRGRYARIFRVLARAGVSRRSLSEAWDFTVASTRDLTGRLLAIRNNAFGQLGDHNLADNIPRGRAPAYQITSVSTLPPSSGFTGTIRTISGTFSVPCYLTVCGAKATAGFHYSSHRRDATPTQIPGNTATAPFECIVPSSASPTNQARVSLYGHGLLGSHREVTASNVEAMATEHNMVFCATDWWGLAEGDSSNDASAVLNLNLFAPVIDRLQQGVLNTLYLGRLLRNAQGFAANPTFQFGGRPVIDSSHLYYDGNSQGGIEGGLTTAVAPDFRRATLGVTGMDYGNVLVQRSTDFAPFGALLYASYPDPSLHPWILDLIQQLWDRGDPEGYAQQMTSHPLPDTPSHTVLMQIAYGDHQVSNFAAALEARTIGASVYEPALDLSTNRKRDRNLFYGLPVIKHFPFGGSAIEIWDSGPGRVQPPLLANLAPMDNPLNNIDPHPDVRNTPLARLQKSEFLEPAGAVFDVCQQHPCRTSVYTP
ncbi:MAG: hypothetical protein ABI323_11905 [Solirubrobacteraceae bacterium]